MYITKAFFSPIRARDWIVQGQIAIEGEFTADEWEKIKTTFIALGLFQMHHGKKPSDLIPTRQMCVDAAMEDARNNDTRATRALMEKYNIPEGTMLPNDVPKLLMDKHRYIDNGR